MTIEEVELDTDEYLVELIGFKILRCLIDADPDYYYTYSYIEGETDIKRPLLKKAMDTLRKEGLVEHRKGLMDEEGFVAGSGFGIVYEKRSQIREILERNEE